MLPKNDTFEQCKDEVAIVFLCDQGEVILLKKEVVERLPKKLSTKEEMMMEKKSYVSILA